MANKLNIKKNVMTTVIAFLINILLTFIGYRLLIDQGGLQALGVWSMLSAAIFVMRIGDIGMGSAAERYTAMISVEENAKQIKGYFDTALAINTFLFSILAVLGWILFSNHIEWIIPKSIELQKQALDLLPLMFLVFVISNIANVFSGGLRGLHLGYLGAYLSIVSNLFQMLLVIYLVPKIGIAGLAWAQLAQNGLIIVAAWIIIYKHMQPYGQISWLPVYASKKLFKELFSFSFRAQAVSLINGLFEPISKFMVGHTAGLSTLGIYELAYKVVSLPRHAVVSGVLSMMPAITRLLSDDIETARKLYYRSRKIVILATLSILTCVVIASPIISWFLFEKIDWLLINFIIVMSVGFLGNVIGAPAYILGFSSAKLLGNLISSVFVIFVLIVGVLITKELFSYGAIISSAVSLFLGGFLIKNINEKILDDCKL
ncbi:MAG: oligosaccharide flippase family protein [Bacilli bacterium]